MKSLSLLLIALSLTALAGCNTVRGVGQDIQRAGSAIERSVK
jgi:predicted small secreted protein